MMPLLVWRESVSWLRNSGYFGMHSRHAEQTRSFNITSDRRKSRPHRGSNAGHAMYAPDVLTPHQPAPLLPWRHFTNYKISPQQAFTASTDGGLRMLDSGASPVVLKIPPIAGAVSCFTPICYICAFPYATSDFSMPALTYTLLGRPTRCNYFEIDPRIVVVRCL